MDRMVLYIPSYNDSELVRQSLATVPDWPVVISDNTSAEPHRSALAALADDRVQVVRQQNSLGRVGNWEFCVRHFVDSGAEWMKFLLAGDRHKPDSLALCRKVLGMYSDARLLVFNVDTVWPGERSRWSTSHETFCLSPAQAMSEVVLRGNVFFGLVTCLLHAQALRGGFSFGTGTLSYCADLQFLMQIAREHPAHYYPEPVAEFIVANRKHFQVGQFTLEHVLEEALLRLRAADAYRDLTGDSRRRDELVAFIGQWLRAALEQSPTRLAGTDTETTATRNQSPR
jgi:hypothetical protein